MKSLSIVIDTQSLLHIQPFNADRNKNLGWSWIFTVAVRAINRSIHDETQKVEDNLVPPRLQPRLRDGRQEISEQLHAHFLRYSVRRRKQELTSDQVYTATDCKCGKLCWRQRLCETQMSLMSRLLDPHSSSSEPRFHLRQWKQRANEDQATAGLGRSKSRGKVRQDIDLKPDVATCHAVTSDVFTNKGGNFGRRCRKIEE